MQERQTKQKAIIYEALCTLDHPTATEVFGYVHKAYPSVSRATIFRVLGGFAASGKALELRTSGNEVRYDFNTMPHFHVRCRCCGKAADVSVEGIPKEGLAAHANGEFEIEGYSVEFIGICSACKVHG